MTAESAWRATLNGTDVQTIARPNEAPLRRTLPANLVLERKEGTATELVWRTCMIMDRLYEEFRDPTEDFAKEPRAFCYDLASEFIAKAKKASGDAWLKDTNTVKGVLLLLYTWNFAAKETKRLTFDNVGTLLSEAKTDLQFLSDYSISSVTGEAWERIAAVFERFRALCGQTGASKALSLLNPHLFVMWDTAIRRRLNRELIPSIGNGQTGEQYVTFLKGVQRIIQEYGIAGKLPAGAIVAKKFDEYNYVRIVMP